MTPTTHDASRSRWLHVAGWHVHAGRSPRTPYPGRGIHWASRAGVLAALSVGRWTYHLEAVRGCYLREWAAVCRLVLDGDR